MGRQVGQGRVQPLLVVMFHPAANNVLGVQLMFQFLIRQPFLSQDAVELFDVSVRFGMINANANFFQAESLDQLPKFLAGKLRAVVVHDPGFSPGCFSKAA